MMHGQKNIKLRILCSITFFRTSCRLWDNVEKYGRTGQATGVNKIRRMRIAWWITKATNTHSKYVILNAFPLQQRLRERVSVVSLYVHCLSCLFSESNGLLTNRFFYLPNGICGTCVGERSKMILPIRCWCQQLTPSTIHQIEKCFVWHVYSHQARSLWYDPLIAVGKH